MMTQVLEGVVIEAVEEAAEEAVVEARGLARVAAVAKEEAGELIEQDVFRMTFPR